MKNLYYLIFSDDFKTKQIPDILYDQLNIKDKELLNKLKKYEIVHPEDIAPIANEFPDFYSRVSIFAVAECYSFFHVMVHLNLVFVINIS